MVTAPLAPPPSLPPPGAHQDRAIERVLTSESVLVEYGTGTGKSRIMVEACTVMVEMGDTPILIIVPNSLLEQTWEEFEKWAGRTWTERNVDVLDKTYTIYQRAQKLKSGRARIFLLSHESLSYLDIRAGVRSRTWAAVLLDEASRFRNHSKRTVTLKTLGSHARTRYAFTGNLTVRNPADSWYVMNWLTPGLFGTTSRSAFIHAYCLLGGYMGNQPIGIRPDKLAQFRMILDANRIKCELRDVRDLPDRVMTVRRVTFSGRQHKAYEQMRLELRAEIMRMSADDFVTHASTYAVRLLRLQEIAAGFGRNTEGEVEYLPSPKTTEMVETILADPDPPTVIWYWYRPELEIIKAHLEKAGLSYVVFGEPNAIEMFMVGGSPIFISQVAKGGYGLNLTRATRMIYHSLPWDLDVYSQSQERNMRLTTTASSLEIVHLLIRGSVDEYVRNRLLDKAGMSRQLSRSQALEMLK